MSAFGGKVDMQAALRKQKARPSWRVFFMSILKADRMMLWLPLEALVLRL